MAPCALNTFAYKLKEGDTLYQLAKTYHTTVYELLSLNPGTYPDKLSVGSVICIPKQKEMAASCVTKQERDLSNALRSLWEQHVMWTRLTIIAIIRDADALPLVTQRLLRNATDMANALKPYYGAEKSAKFGDLIEQHLKIAYQLVTASKNGDNAAAAQAEKAWYTNAADISKFLASINPYWSQSEWQRMLNTHLDLTKAEAVAKLSNNTARSIELYDQIELQALEMADMMTQGIIKQFPGRFK